MTSLQPYKKYYPVSYDYVQSLPDGWKLLPNLAIFQERIERGYENEELLSVTIGRGVIKQSELEKKDSSTLDKSKYLWSIKTKLTIWFTKFSVLDDMLETMESKSGNK